VKSLGRSRVSGTVFRFSVFPDFTRFSGWALRELQAALLVQPDILITDDSGEQAAWTLAGL